MKKRLMTLGLMGVCALSLVSCGGNKDNTPDTDDPGKNPPKYDLNNDTTPLRLSSQELDGVFNPFFSTSGADSSVVSMTQIGMLSNDKDGNLAYGEDEPTVVLDYQEVETGSKDNDDLRTTYYFVLKNNVKFSNGSSLTMRDVLFNLYVYLDPAYTGSSTIYSTDIVGLKEYRTQQEVEGEQDSFMKQFSIEAETRIEDLVSAFEEIMDDNKGSMTEAKMKELLKDISDNASGNNRKHLVEDYDRAIELFKTELENDYTSSLDSYEDISFKKTDNTVFKPFTTDIEAFLYNEGYIQYNKKEDSLTCSFGDLAEVKTWSKEKAIELIYADLIPYKLDQVVQYWAYTSTNLYQDLTNIAMEEYFQGSSSDIKYRNISGIQFANKTEPVTVNGKKYDIPVYDADGITPKAGSYEVLSITIKNIDPKAKWNFSFAVAPMYYYSDQEHISKFDYVSNFGVEYGSTTFMTNVIKSSDKIGVPVGAGAYQAANSDGSTGNVTAGEFRKNNIISYVRNEHFIMGAPKIKNVHLQVIPQKNMMNALDANEVDFVEPNAKPETVKELDEKIKAGQGIAYERIQTMGYGYIGINAGQVPNLVVRQVIMHCINTQECVDYYSTQALAIHRPMSLASWAYPEGATPYYPYIGGAVPENLDVVNPLYADFVTERGYRAGEKLSAEDQAEFVRTMIEDVAGYSEDASGVYKKNNDKLQYTFTIAGNETDHPAFTAMEHARDLLNKWGFSITVKTDSQALRKLATGSLAVWAAAWSSTIDPDMYQVYHKDSKAGSTTNWGYREILQNVGGKYDEEVEIIEELSRLIDQGRETNNQDSRIDTYSLALDQVMKLAVELPTYQRMDLYVYNSDRIDSSSLTPTKDLTPLNGLTTKNWLMSFNVEQ